EWDISQEQWQTRRCSMVLFRPDGKVSEREDHNPNGSVSRSKYSYVEAGRLLESTFQSDPIEDLCSVRSEGHLDFRVKPSILQPRTDRAFYREQIGLSTAVR